MEYQIITQSSHTLLSQRINELIQDGWVPQGGVSFSTTPGGHERYVQAIVREAR